MKERFDVDASTFTEILADTYSTEFRSFAPYKEDKFREEHTDSGPDGTIDYYYSDLRTPRYIFRTDYPDGIVHFFCPSGEVYAIKYPNGSIVKIDGNAEPADTSLGVAYEDATASPTSGDGASLAGADAGDDTDSLD